METVKIKDQLDGTIFDAEFEPIRTVKKLTLGWGTVKGSDFTLRFPIIVDRQFDRVLTVSDWQAPWHNTDLADDEDFEAMVKTGSGTFRTAAGNPTEAYRAFLIAKPA